MRVPDETTSRDVVKQNRQPVKYDMSLSLCFSVGIVRQQNVAHSRGHSIVRFDVIACTPHVLI